MTEYSLRLPDHRVGRDYQPRAAGEEFIVAVPSARHFFNIGDLVWLALLQVSIADYVKTHLGREAVFEFVHQQDQHDINDILDQCLGVRSTEESDYKGKYAKLNEIEQLTYPSDLRTRCVFDRLGGDERRNFFVDKESWSVVMTRGLRNGSELEPLTGMMHAWLRKMSFKAAGYESTHEVDPENYRTPDLIIYANQYKDNGLLNQCGSVDLSYDDIPFFRYHLQPPNGSNKGKLNNTVFNQEGLALQNARAGKFGAISSSNIVPAQPVTELWAIAVGNVLQQIARSHGVDAPEFKLVENMHSPLVDEAMFAVQRKLADADIHGQPLCVIQSSTSMKSKNPPMELLMQEAGLAIASGMQVIFIGAQNDTRPPYLADGMHDWVGETSLAESMMLLRNSHTKHFISGDSGLAHYLGANQRPDQQMTTIFLSSNPDLSRAVSPHLRIIDLGNNPSQVRTPAVRLEA